jgi:DNA-binding IclR family transcriptional regulator
MLVFRDFATQGDDRVYYAGPVLKLDEYSQAEASHLRDVCRKHLRRLTRMTNESSSLVVRTGDRARVLIAIEPAGVATAGARDGMSFTAWRATAGRLGLAELDPAEVDALFPDGHPDPPDPAALRRDLDTIAKQGFAMNAERADRGVAAIGVPLRNAAGDFLAGIAAVMPSSRYEPGMLPGLVTTLRKVAKDIESDLRGGT